MAPLEGTLITSILLLGIFFPWLSEGTVWLRQQECSQTICTCDGTINGIEVLKNSKEPVSVLSYNSSQHAEQCKTYSLGECKFSNIEGPLRRINVVTDNITDIINLGVESVGYVPKVGKFESRSGLQYYNTISGDLVDTSEQIHPETLIELAIKLCPTRHELSIDTFAAFTSLTTLRLRSNDWPVDLHKPGFLANQGQLQGLHIDHVKINQIHKGDFCHLSKLDYIDIKSAGPSVIHGFQCKDTACDGACLVHLETLQLRGNNISFINIQLAQVMPNVEEIDLSENIIQSIQENIFRNLGHLQKLKLSKNMILYVALKSFENVPLLSEVDLSWNNLHSLKMEIFQIVVHLKRLDLSHNLLQEIDNSKIPKNLEGLFLQNNPLRSVGSGTFLSRGKSLKHLDLSHTNLRNLQIWNISHCDVPDMAISEICTPNTMMEVKLNGNR